MTHADPALVHQPVEAEVRHRGDRDEIDAEVERRIATISSPSTDLAGLVDGQHAVAVAVEGDAEVEPPLATTSASSERSVAPQPTLMFVAVRRRSPIGVTSAPSRSNARGAIAEYAPFAQSTAIRRPVEVGAEVLDDVVDVARSRRLACSTDRAASRRRVEQRLDLLLAASVSLWPVAVEELHAVVLGRVVRCGDDDAEVVGEQRDGRRRQHAGEHGRTAGRDDPARERCLELGAGAARVAPDEDAAAARSRARGADRAARRDRR